jgi:guanylate kinase
MRLGPLIILSGPSGSGKSTVVKHLLARRDLPLRLSVSATTRPPRPGEVDGQHYHFWDTARFERALAEGRFLEHARVYGHYYGTLKDEVEPFRRRGIGVLLEIDVQGAAQVRRQCPDAVAVFLRTSSWETYEQRLRQRGTETEDSMRRRLEGAKSELERAGDYHYQVINDHLADAVDQLHDIVQRQFERGSG